MAPYLQVDIVGVRHFKQVFTNRRGNLNGLAVPVYERDVDGGLLPVG